MHLKPLLNSTTLFLPDFKDSILQIHPLILKKLNNKQSTTLFLLDGFGFNLFESFVKLEFREKLVNARIKPISTIFPTSTAPVTTFLLTELLPEKSGIIEYNSYLPSINENIETLPMALLGDKPNSIPDKLKFEDLMWDKGSFFESALKSCEHVVVYMPSFIKVVNLNKKIIYKYYDNVIDGLSLWQVDQENSLKLLVFSYFYYPNIDTESHNHGLYSSQTQNAITDFWNAFEPYAIPKNSAVLITADHGHINNPPLEETLYLQDLVSNIDSYLKVVDNKKILPCGSFRDLFLHANPIYLSELKKHLSKKLIGKALVLELKECFELGLFNENIYAKRHEDVFGNLVIIPETGISVWYRDPKLDYKEVGTHGGLSKDELEIPLIQFN